MASETRERSRSWLIWLIAGVLVALVGLAIHQFARQAQQADLPRPADLAIEAPTPPSLPDMPNLPPAPLPTPR